MSFLRFFGENPILSIVLIGATIGALILVHQNKHNKFTGYPRVKNPSWYDD